MPTNDEKKGIFQLINKPLFFPPAIVLVALVLYGLVNKEGFASAANFLLGGALANFSWFYAFGSTLLLGFCLWAGFSKYGQIKLGGPKAKPELSTFNWWAISLCTGIAVGIVFYGVAEPMTHYMNPPAFLNTEPRSIVAATAAVRYSFFHWTFHTYGIYVSTALCSAFFFFNAKKGFKVSSALFPFLGDKIKGTWGYVVDGLAIFAIVGGVGTSMGFGTLQIGGGLNFVWNIAPGPAVWFTIIVVLIVCYTISSYSGLHKGIKFLSSTNVYLYFFLMLFVIITGPTIHVLESTITNIGDYLINLLPMSFFLDPYGKSGWPSGWSIFYWAWWLAFAPIVGLFLARCAYGRTIKEFVTVNLLAPCFFGMIWFGVFGNAAIYLDHFLGTNIGETINNLGIEVSLFALFEKLPRPGLTMILGMLCVAISFITLADSMTSTLGAMTTVGYGEDGKATEAPAPLKIFWGVMMGLLTFVLLVTGGTAALQTSVIVCGLPILVLQLFMVVNYIKAMLKLEQYDVVSGKAFIQHLTNPYNQYTDDGAPDATPDVKDSGASVTG